MSDLELYFQLGISHILDLSGFDHILFIIALSIIYTFQQWRKLLWLVSAFTIGHCITLALSTSRLVNVNSSLVEFLIPITILFTAISNVFIDFNSAENDLKLWFRYFSALFFGFIHGLGFSNFLKSMLGKADSITFPLLYFNVGLELGQLIIVSVTLLISFSVIHFLKLKIKLIVTVVSSCVAMISIYFIWQNWIF